MPRVIEKRWGNQRFALLLRREKIGLAETLENIGNHAFRSSSAGKTAYESVFFDRSKNTFWDRSKENTSPFFGPTELIREMS